MRGGPALITLFSFSALLLASLIAHAEVGVEVLDTKTVLTQYGLNATYRSELVNISLLIVSYEPIHNVTIVKVEGADLIRSDIIATVSRESTLNLTIKIPRNVPLGINDVVLHLRYYTLPQPSEVCNVSEGTITLYACVESNITLGTNATLYIYTYPYMDKELIVLRDGKVVLNTTIYSWRYYRVLGPGRYLIRVSSVRGNASLILISEEAVPIRHELNVKVPIEVIARNVTSLDIALNTTGNSIVISNTYNFTGQLIIRNITVNVYSGIIKGTSLKWILNKTYLIPKLALDESKALLVPWDLRHNPLVNVTVTVCDDVHGCFTINKTMLGPLIQGCNHVVFRAMDSEGNPLSGALISFGGVSVRTDYSGRASLEVYPVGRALVKYDSKTVHVDVLGCGEYNVVLDLNPPRVLSIDNPKPGVLFVRAVDETPMHIWVDGLGPFGPFNNSIVIYLPTIESSNVKVVIKDSFNNSVSVVTNFKPLMINTINYEWLGLISIATLSLLFIAFTLIARLS